MRVVVALIPFHCNFLFPIPHFSGVCSFKRESCQRFTPSLSPSATNKPFARLDTFYCFGHSVSLCIISMLFVLCVRLCRSCWIKSILLPLVLELLYSLCVENVKIVGLKVYYVTVCRSSTGWTASANIGPLFWCSC